MIGAYSAATLKEWENECGYDWRAYIDDLVAHVNYCRLWLNIHNGIEASTGDICPDTGEGTEFSEQVECFERIDADKFDLSEYDEEFWRRLELFLGKSEEKRLITELCIFNPWAAQEGVRWPVSPWNPANNINYDNSKIKESADLYELKDGRVWELQKMFLDKVLSTVKDCKYVILEVANEGGGDQWHKDVIRYIKEHSDILVAACDSYTDYDACRGECDIVNFHFGGQYNPPDEKMAHLAAHAQQLLTIGGKPVAYDECYNCNGGMPNAGNWEVLKHIVETVDGVGAGLNWMDWCFWRKRGKPPAEALKILKEVRDS